MVALPARQGAQLWVDRALISNFDSRSRSARPGRARADHRRRRRRVAGGGLSAGRRRHGFGPERGGVAGVPFRKRQEFNAIDEAGGFAARRDPILRPGETSGAGGDRQAEVVKDARDWIWTVAADVGALLLDMRAQEQELMVLGQDIKRRGRRSTPRDRG